MSSRSILLTLLFSLSCIILWILFVDNKYLWKFKCAFKSALQSAWLLCALIFVCTNIAWSLIALTVRCHLTSRGLKMVFSLRALWYFITRMCSTFVRKEFDWWFISVKTFHWTWMIFHRPLSSSLIIVIQRMSNWWISWVSFSQHANEAKQYSSNRPEVVVP